ncbi:hypothetical protein [Micromonospora sp. NBC_01412]|uniref:hypothetical protein n=1 Tax=Micromonospora sp. NBC_01412 TaxID=2903590 RepID=UPI00324E1250
MTAADDIETAALVIAEYGRYDAVSVLITSGLYGWDRDRASDAVTAALPLARTLTTPAASRG